MWHLCSISGLWDTKPLRMKEKQETNCCAVKQEKNIVLLTVQQPWGVLLVMRELPEPCGEGEASQGRARWWCDTETHCPEHSAWPRVHSVTDGAGSRGGLVVIITETPRPNADTFPLALPAETHPALPKKPHEQTTCLSIPKGYLSKTLREMMTGRPVVSTYHNFLKGLQLHNKYLDNESFCMWKGNWKLFWLHLWKRFECWYLVRTNIW